MLTEHDKSAPWVCLGLRHGRSCPRRQLTSDVRIRSDSCDRLVEESEGGQKDR